MINCTCADPKDAAIVTTCFMASPETWQAEFTLEHKGKLVCFHCGGFIEPSRVNNQYDHVTATTVTERLNELGLIGPARTPAQ
jgi:hypothetical protein